MEGGRGGEGRGSPESFELILAAFNGEHVYGLEKPFHSICSLEMSATVHKSVGVAIKR